MTVTSMSTIPIFAVVILAVGSTVATAAETLQVPAPSARSEESPAGAVLSPSEERHLQEATRFFEKEAKRSSNMYMGFAKLFLNRDLEEGNKNIRAAYDRMLKESADDMNVEDASKMTPEIAQSERLKWQMRTWVRIYYLFSDKSKVYPGRLKQENQKLIEALFWNYLNAERNQI